MSAVTRRSRSGLWRPAARRRCWPKRPHIKANRLTLRTINPKVCCAFRNIGSRRRATRSSTSIPICRFRKDETNRYSATPADVLPVMDRRNLQTMVNLTGGRGAGLREAIQKFDKHTQGGSSRLQSHGGAVLTNRTIRNGRPIRYNRLCATEQRSESLEDTWTLSSRQGRQTRHS